LWNGANPDGFIGQMWMRTTVTLTPEQAAQPGPVVDLGSVNQEDETWVNGAYAGASSFANRTRYAIEPGVLKAGVNVIVTNVHCAGSYYQATLLGMMAERRRQFEDPDLPFLLVQLPGYGPIPAQPAVSTWASLREAQRQTALADKHAAIAVTVDIGDLADLHP